jgi:cob(I)alamin adenosyltransferase
MKIYTRTGDDGTTSLAGGKRVLKSSLRVEAYGSVDELIAWIGLLRDCNVDKDRNGLLIFIQDQLMRIAATLATEAGDKRMEAFLPGPGSVSVLEDEIDRMGSKLPEQTHFILPGGHILVSYCHIARCVCRRVERAVLRLKNDEDVPEIITKFLNRLSDYLYILSRTITLELDIQDIKWPF